MDSAFPLEKRRGSNVSVMVVSWKDQGLVSSNPSLESIKEIEGFSKECQLPMRRRVAHQNQSNQNPSFTAMVSLSFLGTWELVCLLILSLGVNI
jgi:hypothetical protein